VADRSCVALRHAVRDGVVACDHARPTNIAGVHRAAAEAVGRVGLEMTSAARRGVEGVNASAMEASTVEAAGMNTAAAMKAATAMEAAATTVETAAATTVETATAAAVETAATAAAMAATTTTTASTRLRHVRQHQPRDCGREDRGQRDWNLDTAGSSQHVFLHLV
jgi:hypothetical protein